MEKNNKVVEAISTIQKYTVQEENKTFINRENGNVVSLIKQRDTVSKKIREIEKLCEGIENENNAKMVDDLKIKQERCVEQRKDLMKNISVLDERIRSIRDEIATVSGKGIERILDAIKNQRWYFFKNKTKVLLDRYTGLLWANLQHTTSFSEYITREYRVY